MKKFRLNYEMLGDLAFMALVTVIMLYGVIPLLRWLF